MIAYTEPDSGSDGRITITRFTHCRSSCTAYHVSGVLFIPLCPHRCDVADLPMKTVHPVQSVLPNEPRPPARTGMDNSAPMIDVAVTKVTERRVEVGDGWASGKWAPMADRCRA